MSGGATTGRRLTIVRHGETEWSRDGKHTGRTDIELTDEGRSVALQLEATLRRRTFAAVFTSPLARARDTAALAGFPDAAVDDDLREWNYGDYEGRTTDEIRTGSDPGWLLWDDGVPNGESLADVATRADVFLARVHEVDGDTLAFAHGHLLRVLAARWLRCDPGFARHLALSPATISTLGWERDVPAVLIWNSSPA